MRKPSWLQPNAAAEIEAIVDRARAIPNGDDRRWRVLAELNGWDQGQLVRHSARLLASGQPEEMILGAQMLDGFAVSLTPTRRDRAVITAPLRAAISPNQDPEVIAAAMSPYFSFLRQPDYTVLRHAIHHPAAQVRQDAVGLLAAVISSPKNAAARTAADLKADRANLMAALAQDPEPGVREEAAAGLSGLYFVTTLQQGDTVAAREIHQHLHGYRHDPLPRIRAAALKVCIRADPTTDSLQQLAQELANPLADWHFVQAIQSVVAGLADPSQADVLLEPLIRLRDEGWPTLIGLPSKYPDTAARTELLDEAIASARQRGLDELP